MKFRILLLVACVSIAGLAGITTAGMNQQKQAGAQARLQAVQLTDEEILSIWYMRQEEKLARDVYITLYEQWGTRVFENIIESEQNHMDAIKRLIDLYNLEDPITDNTTGVYADSEFTQQYVELTDQGAISLLDAYFVGVAIEEMDIADLTIRLEDATTRNVRRVFENLLAGSERHLAAFQRNIDNYDTECQETCVNCSTCIQACDRDGSCINQ